MNFQAFMLHLNFMIGMLKIQSFTFEINKHLHDVIAHRLRFLYRSFLIFSSHIRWNLSNQLLILFSNCVSGFRRKNRSFLTDENLSDVIDGQKDQKIM